MSTDVARFPFLRLRPGHPTRPLLWVYLENLHADGFESAAYPALLDTGADSSLAPRYICEKLGHIFDAGTEPSTAGGVGAGRLQTFKHMARITVLATPESGEPPGAGDALFSPIEFPLTCVDQFLPFILLGQADFLNLFEYAQHRPERWFTLRRLEESEVAAKAAARLMELSADDETRMLADAREKARRDQIARERYVREESRAEGRAEGEANKQIEIARRLLQKKMSVSEVASTTGLPESDVRRLAVEDGR